MNRILNRIILFAGISAAVSACNSPDEIVDQIDYARVLTPLKFEAEVVPSTGTDVIFTWQDMKNADGYLLEIYTMPEDAEIVPSTPTGSPLKTINVDKTDIPYTVYDLEVDKSFYARLQGCSNTLDASNWTYLEEAFSTSAVRSSLNPVVSVRTSSSITISWDAAEDKADLTSVKVEPVLPLEGETVRTLALTPEEVDACTKTVGELNPGREYRFTLLFGKAGKRGSVTGFARPNTEGTTLVSSAGAILSAINSQSGTVKLLVEYSDTPYDFISAYTSETEKFVKVAGDVHIYGKSSENGKKPVLNGLTFSLTEGATVLHIEDLCFDGQNEGTLCANPKAAMSKVEYVNCEITNFSKAIYSNGSSDTGSFTDLLIDGCYVHDINATGANGGDFIDVRGGVNGNILIQNSTFYAVARTFLRASDKAKLETATIRNCTFNYVTSTTSSSNNAGIFHVRQTTEAKSLQCLNNVFLNQYNDKETAGDASKSWVRLARNSTDSYSPYCEGNVYYHVGAAWWTSSAPGAPNDLNVGVAFSEELGMKDGLMLTEDPCVNSEAGKLYLTSKGAEIVTMKAGDPKWWDAVQPVIIRPTELEVAPDEYAWDFTDKTVYDTEEIVANTIIGNARIYATASVPAQVTMSKGITLKPASVSPDGVPSYGGVEILTNGYGSVKVTARSADGFGSVQVLAGGDRYPILADGEEHIVNLGDLNGENSIYVIADQEITLEKIVWTKDLTPEETKIVLDKPEVTVNPTSVFVGDSQDVVISWTEVENAAVYALTNFDGTSITTDKTLFTITGDEIAQLAVGEYEFTVVAKPVGTSTKYVGSEAGKAKFKVNAKTPTVTWKWDFTEEFKSKIEVKDSQVYKYNDGEVTVAESSDVEGQLYFAPNAKAIKSNDLNCTADGKTYHPLSYGGGAAYMFFKTAKAGKLRVTATIGKNPAEATDCKLGIKVNGAEYGENVDLAAYDLTVNGCAARTFEWNITNAGTDVQEIRIVKPSGSNSPFIFSVEFEYEAGAKENYVWDFSTQAWQDLFSPMGEAGKDIEGKTWDFTVDGLNFYSTQKNRWNTTYIQTGGTGSDTDRVFTFTAKGAGYLYVTASNTGSSEDTAREVYVQIAEDATTKQSKIGGAASSSPVTLEFEVGAGVQKIYSNKALRFYRIEFHTDQAVK